MNKEDQMLPVSEIVPGSIFRACALLPPNQRVASMMSVRVLSGFAEYFELTPEVLHLLSAEAQEAIVAQVKDSLAIEAQP